MVPKPPSGGKGRRVSITLLLLTTALTGVWVLRTPRNSESTAVPISPAKRTNPDRPAEPRPALAGDRIIPEEFHLGINGATQPYKLALDQVATRQGGQYGTIVLDPPATPKTLASRIAKLQETQAAQVLPVCYPAGLEHNKYTRAIITPDVVVKLAPGSNALPALPAGVQVAERPNYAPDLARLTASDSFAAVQLAGELGRDPGLAAVELQLAVQKMPMAMPNDPLIPNQWHLKYQGQANTIAGTDINVESIWGYPGSTSGIRGRGIHVAVIDVGTEMNHPDLAANADVADGRDYNSAAPGGIDNDPSPGPGDDHGTACAGNVAARGGNNLGGSGSAPEATLVGVRLIAGPTTDAVDADAMEYLNNGSTVVEVKSNSWGPYAGYLGGPGLSAAAALDDGTANGRGGLGTIYLFSAGNDGDHTDNANYDSWCNSINVICVAGTDSLGHHAYYSEPGSCVLIATPTQGASPSLAITTTDRVGKNGYNTAAGTAGNYTNTFNGTSSSCPTAAGVVALMLEKNPTLGWRDVQEILIKSAVKFDAGDTDWVDNGANLHFNHKYGAGLVDATAAVNMADGWVNLSPQQTLTRSASGTGALAGAIPDGDANGKSFTFDFGGTGMRVEHAAVTVNMDHLATGELEISLISPDGTISRLAEQHNYSGPNFLYAPWTFTSVHSWGENSSGVWTLRIADRSKNSNHGSLLSASLSLYGSPAAPKNPPPVVTITNPGANSVFSPGASFDATVTATDLTNTGDPGVVSKVELYDNNALVATKTAPPYTFPLTPAVGTHTLKAKATDSENAFRYSVPVTFKVYNQPPVITGLAITPGPQAFSDESVTVTTLSATDPESDPITYTYQWEKSSDTYNYTAADGFTAASLPTGAANSGYLWRCEVTAHDDHGNATTQASNSVNVLTRPPASAAASSVVSYNPGLVIRDTDTPIFRPVIINEFSQGSNNLSNSSGEWVELLVMKTTSLRNFRLTNAVNNQLVFTDNKAWDNIPAGTMIIIYNGAAKDPLLPKADTKVADKTLVLASNNGTYFVRGSVWPGFKNSGDAVYLRDATFTPVHQFCYGDNNTVTPNLGNIDTGMSAGYIGKSDLGVDDVANWKITTGLSVRGNPVSTATGGYATGGLPFNYGGPWDKAPFNMTFYKTKLYYASLAGDTTPGSAKLDKGGEYVLVSFDGTPDTVSYSLAATGNAGYATFGQFVLEESADNVTFTRVRAIQNKTYGVATFTDTLKPTTRHIKFLYNQQVYGYVLLDKISVLPRNPLFISASPTKFSEAAGANASTGTVSLIGPAAVDFTVNIASSDTTAATVPATVTIPAGQQSATFPIAAVDDLLSDGDQAADITVSAPDYSSNYYTVIVTDNEPSVEGVTPLLGNSPDNVGFVAALRSGSLVHPSTYRLGTGSDALPAGLTLNTSTGLLSGTVSASAANGDYTIIIERYNFLDESTSITFVLTVTGGLSPSPMLVSAPGKSATAPHSSRAVSPGASNSTVADTENSDRDGDGLGDLAERYLGGNPDVADADAHTPITESTDTTTSIVYVRSDEGAASVDAVVEWSTTPADGPWSSEGVTEEILDHSNGLTKVRATVSDLPTEPQKYLRLRVFAKP